MQRAHAVTFAKSIWLTLCLLVLLYAWTYRAYDDPDVVVIWALIVLTFPLRLLSPQSAPEYSSSWIVLPA